MRRKSGYLILMAILLISMTLLGCSSNDVANNDSLEKSLVEEKEEEMQKEAQEADERGKRSSPISIGETVKWQVKFYADADDWDGLEGLANVSLNQVYKDEEAINMLYFGAEALDEVEDGYTYAVADMTVELVEGDEDSPYTSSFHIGSVSEDGRQSPSKYVSLSDDYEDNEYTDLYPGGTVDIKKAFLVPKEGDYLVEIEENISGKKFFKAE